MRTPMALRKACVSASVLDISIEKISDPAIIAKGVSSPSARGSHSFPFQLNLSAG